MISMVTPSIDKRFIPTRVGPMQNAALNCGANLRFIPTRVGPIKTKIKQMFVSTGSSPHAWGQFAFQPLRHLPQTVHPHTRGANVPLTTQYLTPAVHPHTRGANLRPQPILPECTAVHPHTRGANFSAAQKAFIRFRFIPTRVGPMNVEFPTLPFAIRFIPTRVGPMWVHLQSGREHNGSSPHAWGQCQPITLIRALFAVHPHTRGANTSKNQAIAGF